jgi:hypothetical protein
MKQLSMEDLSLWMLVRAIMHFLSTIIGYCCAGFVHNR